MTKNIKALNNISNLVTLDGAHSKDGRKLSPSDLSIINDGAIVFSEDEILWVGKTRDFPTKYNHIHAEDMTGKTIVPEVVDSHTHLIFGGDRSKEYSMRLNGADYQEIANAGGGILSTTNSTNSMTRAELKDKARERINNINRYGVGTIEIKSGYGLNTKKERELSEIIYELKEELSPRVQIINTYMAAHAIPQEYDSSAAYVDDVVIPLMEQLHGRGAIDAVDIFHEEGYFNSKDVESIFDRAKELSLPTKVHADEFGDNKGAKIACQYNSISADHLLNTGDDGIAALANSNTVATLLPGTGFFLGKKQAHARKFLDAGVKVAIASDYNPGSCHCDNVILLASLIAPEYKINLCELWASITLNAAHALGLKQQGAIKIGLKPRFSIFFTDSIDRITYSWGRNLSGNRDVSF